MRLSSICIALLAAVAMQAQTDGPYYVKDLVFPPGASDSAKVAMAARVVPTDEQLRWQDLEMTAFVHFGVNTFTGREWGDGSESPDIFRPDSLDTDQWVRTLKDAGFSLIILTAKHHDGFCLWPTETTAHSVKSSTWRDGRGDVVADLRRSADRYGMKLGLYLSPWDRNAPSYGDSEAYNDLFVRQLTELLTRYGRVDEVWFDGACGEGPNGKRQEYDWTRFRQVMRTLQPEAVLAINGDDVRWVGNERGLGRQTEWSLTPLRSDIFPDSKDTNTALGITATSKDLGSRDLLAHADRVNWWPSEVDVSIRPGWFWHPNENPHSLAKMADIYLSSVGRNSVLLLNIPPDTLGRFDARDVQRLHQFGRWIDDNFGPQATLSGETLSADGLTATYPVPTEINAVVLGEDITRGQRVESFDIEALVNGLWTDVASGTTIGRKRILTFDPVTATALRLRVAQYRGDRHHASITSGRHITMPSDE